jgi:predicted  nucleic acid-binding Zn-ribbon protein
MSQRDGFTNGFFLGTFVGGVVGGVVGGILGAVVMSRRDAKLAEEEQIESSQTKAGANESLEMETARRSLEDKIAHLNETIDQVRNQLGTVNNNSSPEVKEHYLSQD